MVKFNILIKFLLLLLLSNLLINSAFTQEISGTSNEQEIKKKKNVKKDLPADTTYKLTEKDSAALYNEIAEKNYTSGDFNNSIENYEKSYLLNIEKGDKQAGSASLTNIGIVYQNIFRYDDAIKYYEKSLRIKEELKDKPGVTRILFRLGNVYYLKQNLFKSLEYFKRTLEIDQELKNQKDVATSQNNMGVIYYDLKDYQKATEYYQKALTFLETTGNEKELSLTLNNIGNINFDINKLKKALQYYEKSLQIKEKLNYQKGMAISLHNIGNVYKLMKNNDKAIASYIKSNEYASKNNEEEVLVKNYIALSGIYSSLKNYQKALECYELISTTKQLIYNVKSGRQISEMQIKYETEVNIRSEEISMLKEELINQKIFTQNLAKEKETEVKLKNAEILRATAEVKQQKTQKIAFVAGFILVLILLIIAYISFRQKRTANILLTAQKEEILKKNEELTQQKEEITTQRDEIEAQRDEIQLQKQLLEHKNRDVMDSIHYAKFIQQAILPPKEYISLNLPEHFILFKPRDIVSGDFYWTRVFNNNLIFCVADCTGHGVPGAFMSMLGIALLNEVTNNFDKNSITASEILNKLRSNLIKSLHQTGKFGETHDGMDIALCILDLSNSKLQFAGAHNPLYIIHKSSNQLTEIKADRMPIGIYDENEIPFTNNDLQLSKGDYIYIFSDGFADQFGGVDHKKFLYKNLKQIMTEIASFPVNEQKLKLDTCFENWKGESEQIDDVTVLGLRIN